MAAKKYSEQELLGKTKLGLRDVLKELGLEFDNAKSNEEIIKMILTAQKSGGGHNVDNDPDGDEEDNTAGNVTITCGGSTGVFQVVGKSIAYCRKEFTASHNIARDSEALLNGTKMADENHILKDEDYLEFVKKSGDKL